VDAQPILQFDVAYPERLSRGLIFIKWLLIIPHLVVLYFLQLALNLTTFIGFFAILFTGKYPRGLWDFGVMVMTWQARIAAYMLLQRDEYPPFGDGDYPVLFHLDYPQRLSRGLIFIKWLLIIPHLIVLSILGIAAGIVWIIAWFAILFTGNYPRSLFDFTTGVSRWAHRVNVYTYLLTDAYPPFTMDQVPSPTAPAPPQTYQPIPPQAW
jgi:hypothetical protein